jgi:putative Mg2+ transporter-C (MgtC) family protein
LGNKGKCNGKRERCDAFCALDVNCILSKLKWILAMPQLEALKNLHNTSLLDTLISLTFAFVLGALIGFERQYRQRTAGLRTNVLVAVGAAIFVDIADRLYGHEGAVRVVSYVVSGIGFLGAGVIMREGGNVRGLNTAATLWCSAAVGACAGADFIGEAILGCGFVLAANTLLRPLVSLVNRQPLDVTALEVTNTIYVIASRDQQKEAMILLEEALTEAQYPARSVTVHPFGDDDIKVEATLMSQSVNRQELDHLVEALSKKPAVHQAFWNPSAAE